MLTTADKQSCLQSCALFSGLESGTLAVLAEALEEEQYGKGEEVWLQGEEADRVYVVFRGTIGIFLTGVPTPVRSLGRGDIVGEYGLFSGTRTATVKAEDEAVLLSIDYPRFKRFLFQYPAAMYGLLGTAVHRLAEAEARLRRK